jgi:hypothetical protein
MEERTQIIRSLDHIGAAGRRLRGDAKLAGGAEVCATQARAIQRDKHAARASRIEDGKDLERNEGDLEGTVTPVPRSGCNPTLQKVLNSIIPTFPYSNIPVEVIAMSLLVKKLKELLWHIR